MDTPSQSDIERDGESPQGPKRKKWVSPQIIDLPRLTDLTLASPILGGGDTGGGGSGVF